MPAKDPQDYVDRQRDILLESAKHPSETGFLKRVEKRFVGPSRQPKKLVRRSPRSQGALQGTAQLQRSDVDVLEDHAR